MTLPIRREESAYSIVSGAAIKRLLFRSFCTLPIRYIWTCYQALGYVKEAYQTLAQGTNHGGLGLFGHFVVLVYEPIQDS